MKNLFCVLFVLLAFGCRAQKSILFKGLHSKSKIEIFDNKKALFSYSYHTSVSFNFSCNLVKLNDSLMQFNNSIKTKDTLIYSKSSKKNVIIPKLKFIGINDYGQKNILTKNYEIINVSEDNSKKILLFKHNHRDYAYTIDSKYKNIDVYIDLTNSFLINLWRVRKKEMIPIIHGEVNLKRRHLFDAPGCR